MSRWRPRLGVKRPRPLPFPEPVPSGLNHVVLTGRLLEEPVPGRSPRGDAVTLLRLGFGVRDPAQPADLWTLARCEVEVPASHLGRGGLPGLEAGAPLLVWGQVSDRESSGGQGGAVLASAVKSGMVTRGRLR